MLRLHLRGVQRRPLVRLWDVLLDLLLALLHLSRLQGIFRKCIFRKFCKFLAGSFSAVSKRNFARKYAFDSIFQALQDLHPFAPLQSQNFRKKSVWKNSNFRENSAKISQMSQNLQNIAKFQKFQLENLVDFEKCCKTHILLQKSEPIQPKTSNILPKFCQPTPSDFGQSVPGLVSVPRRKSEERLRQRDRATVELQTKVQCPWL